MLTRPRFKPVALIIILPLFSYAICVSSLPNIRILVNNENLKSPPYLLETIRQIEANLTTTTSPPVAKPKEEPANEPLIKTNKFQESRVASGYSGSNKNETSADLLDLDNMDRLRNEPAVNENDNGFSLVKEETIEEILDFDQESSPLKLAPSALINAVDRFTKSQEDQRGPEVAAASEEQAQISSSEHQQQPVQSARKPQQLPVTSAHLKRPVVLLTDKDTSSSVVVASNASLDAALGGGGGGGGGAKSLVSASVASDEEESSLEEKKRKKINLNQKPPPDTLEPSQVMQGVTNASLVPATIHRDYGQHSRTRVTLGGGYVRDRKPALVNPASSAYNDDRPEKPVVPLEKPTSSSSSSSESSNSDQATEPEASKVPEESQPKVVKKKQQGAVIKSSSITSSAKIDPRCPKEGVTTFEHALNCDKYYYCENGVSTEMTCPNGLMYGTQNVVLDYCIHRWLASCDDKLMPNPISSPGCRWQYGIFNVQGSPKCSPDFYECFDGKYAVKKCSIEGQLYDDRTKTCKFAELVGCTQEALADFTCPPDDQANTYWPFPRYFLNERALIHCVNDKPQIVRCTNDERVDPEHLHCVPLSKLLPDSSSVGAAAANLQSRKLTREKKEKHKEA